MNLEVVRVVAKIRLNRHGNQSDSVVKLQVVNAIRPSHVVLARRPHGLDDLDDPVSDHSSGPHGFLTAVTRTWPQSRIAVAATSQS